MPEPAEVLRIIDGQTVCFNINQQEKIIRLARICALPLDMATSYMTDMLFLHEVMIESNTDNTAEVYFKSEGKLFNLSDQMMHLGFALPCA